MISPTSDFPLRNVITTDLTNIDKSFNDSIKDVLYLAVLNNDLSSVSSLLNFGRSANIRYSDNRTLLDAYIKLRKQQPNPEILRVLLEHNLLDAGSDFAILGNTQEICSVMNPTQEELEVFFEHISTYRYNKQELKSITDAIFHSRAFDFLERCLDAGVALFLSNGFGGNPYLNLLQEKKYDLLKRLSLSTCSSALLLDNALQRKVTENNLEDATFLISLGAKLENIPPSAMIKIYRDDYELYRWIIDQLGTRVTQIDNTLGPNLLQELLHLGASSLPRNDHAQWLKDLEELVILGFSPTKDYFDSTIEIATYSPLDMAAKRKQFDVCRLFITLMGYDPNNSKLHNAILDENLEKIKNCIEEPLYWFSTNSCHQTPLDLIIEHNKLNLLPLFAPFIHVKSIHQGKIARKPILTALKYQHYVMAEALWNMGLKYKSLLKSNLVVDNSDIINFCASLDSRVPDIHRLFEACKYDDIEFVKEIFLSKEWLINVAFNGMTAFGIAANNNSKKVINFLFEKGFSIFGPLHFIESSKVSPNSTPLYEALSIRSDEAMMFLDSLPLLPTAEDLLINPNAISAKAKKTYQALITIYQKLLEQNDLKGILLLASHPKSKKVILREGIVRALTCNFPNNDFWQRISTLNEMINAGFDVNGIIKSTVGSSKALTTPLLYAIYINDLDLTKFFLEQGAILEPFIDPIYHVLNPFIATYIEKYKQPDIEILLLLINEYKQKFLPIPLDILIKIAGSFPVDNRLLISLLGMKNTLIEEENIIIANNFLQFIYHSNLKIEDSFFELFNYGLKYLKNVKDWNDFIKEAGEFINSFTTKFPYLQGDTYDGSIISRILNQIYYHILCGTNPLLIKEPHVITRIAELLINIPPRLIDEALLALQVCSSLSAVENGIKFQILVDSRNEKLSSALFKIQTLIIPVNTLMPFLFEEMATVIKYESKFARLDDEIINFKRNPLFKFFKDKDFINLQKYIRNIPAASFSTSVLYHEDRTRIFQPFDVDLHIEGWLNYFSVFRTRLGLTFCNQVLKYQKHSPKIILLALETLQRIGIKRWSKSIENIQINEIISIIKTSVDISVKNQAFKTVWALSGDNREEKFKKMIAKELIRLNFDDLEEKNYALTLLDLLGNYDYSDSLIGKKTARILLQFLKHKDIDVVYQAALSISKTDDREGLLECLKIIEGPVWKKHNDNEGKNNFHSSGSFLMFRHRPAEIHDNRHAMRLRILDRLANLETCSVKFMIEIQQRYEAFIENSSCNPDLKLFVEHFYQIPRICTRYVGMPLYLPSGCAVGRGLSSRKGEELFFESVRDLIRKGCGSTDLTLESSVVEGQTWGRIGHIFATHNPRLFFNRDSIYFNGSNSAFIVISSDYYNSELMRGDARLESEGTFNALWYRGVPKKYLQAIFLEIQNQNDIELLSGDQSIESIKDNLTSPIFKDQSVKELVHLRRHLLAKDSVTIKEEEFHLSLSERIRYYDSSKSPSLPIEDVEDVGFKFADEKAFLEESVKRAIGRQLILEKL